MSTPTDDAHAHYTTPLHETTDELRTALRAHGLDVPGLRAEQGSIDLGDVTVTTADRLAHLLGAPVQET
ncbi:SAP domain-containing protein [Streptomyces sp. NPDC059943]|uniref:SAP domain-containing protein n=1 Tax=Streptomyces sp. NPDC059943 TaxID=3347010 RepID=UPI0036600343